MDIKTLLTVFAVVFTAELGDKTQLATLLFAADKEASKLTVFAGASLALIGQNGARLELLTYSDSSKVVSIANHEAHDPW